MPTVVPLGTSSLCSPPSKSPRLVSGNPPRPQSILNSTLKIDFPSFSFCHRGVHQILGACEESVSRGGRIWPKVHMVSDYFTGEHDEKLVIIGMAPTEELIAIGMAPTEPWISDSTVQICLTTYTFFPSLNQSPRVLHVSRGFKWLQQNPI
ncbi:hypothetical protein SDJN03_27523, partial [Cucurbita argyrosperma subsp. sororia]